MFEAWQSRLIVNEPIKNCYAGDVCYGFEFKLSYVTYRGTYLSCIEKLELYIDGKQYPNTDVIFELNGKQFMLSELPELFDEYWYLLDYAVIRIYSFGGLPEGSAHSIRAVLKHREPYTGYFGTYACETADDTKRLTVGCGGTQI